MLIDLLSPGNQVSYNVNLAKKFGLEAAVYVSQLLDICEKAHRKKTLINDKYFKIDEKYITERTTLDKKKQKEIEQNLVEFKLVERSDDKKAVYLDVNKLVSLSMDDDEQFIKDIRSAVDVNKETKKSVKKSYQLQSVKNAITTNYMPVHKAYEEWLDAVDEKFNYVNVRLLRAAEKVVDAYSLVGNGQRDANKSIELLKYAADYGFQNMENAKDSFMKHQLNVIKNTDIQSTVHSSNSSDVLNLSGEEF